jgi:uncharacterized membrane protein
MSILLRATALGLATGSRSTVGLAALALSAERTGSWQTSRWTARLATTAAAGELIGDKLPQTPSRLLPPGLAGRLVFGAAGAAILSHREGNSRSNTLLATALGLAGSAATCWGGASWRKAASGKFGNDLPGALAEDAGCLALARYAVSG